MTSALRRHISISIDRLEPICVAFIVADLVMRSAASMMATSTTTPIDASTPSVQWNMNKTAR